MAKTGEKPTKLEDIALVELALQRDQGAFALLLEKYRGSLMTHILKYVTVVEDAEDICQRSFEKAFMNIDKYNSQYAFSTWLYNIAQNEAIDHLRRSRASINSVPISEERDALDVMAATTPEEELIIDQAVSELISGIQRLPESYRQVAELRFIKDYAYEDIARELGLPLGTVKTRISRARKQLEKIVENPADGKAD
ncbi:MAG: sigma-70 family RNA polymerase sigma factor [Bacteroidales bacterium]|jgi:RNA polymerase sigma-70 factor (ECF subfamily)|nr:sigma-70 family RNA polymerase sigma factor [Bacteroidales bacterium]MBQ9398286.1 sigma-70 family RNA polymerase sigma factor [Bacteroidales bacterium]